MIEDAAIGSAFIVFNLLTLGAQCKMQDLLNKYVYNVQRSTEVSDECRHVFKKTNQMNVC